MTEKLSPVAQADLRGKIYGCITDAIQGNGYEVEKSVNGILVNVGDNQFVEVKVTYKNPEKFDINDARAEYADHEAKRAERIAKAAERAAAKAAEAQKKAEEAAAKVEA